VTDGRARHPAAVNSDIIRRLNAMTTDKIGDWQIVASQTNDRAAPFFPF